MRKLIAVCGLLIASIASKSQIVSTNAFLKGNYVEVGISPCGSFGTSVDAPTGYHPRGQNLPNRLGFVADVGKDGWATGTPNYVGDYFVPGTPEEGWGVSINGTDYSNRQICTQNNIPGSFISYDNTSSEVGATWLGSVGGLSIKSRTYIPVNSTYFITEVTIQNTTQAAINNIYYMRNVDPDQGVATPGSTSTYATTNTIVYQTPNACNQALVSATVNGSLYLGLGSIDSRARVTRGGFFNISAVGIWNGTGLSTSGVATADEAISLAFNIGTLAPNSSTKLAYAYILDEAQLAQALAATNINLSLDGVNYSTGNATNICSGTAVPINLSNTGTFTSWVWTPSTGLNTTSGTSVIATITSPITYTATGTGACGNTSVTISLNPIVQPLPASAGAISGLSVIGLGQTNVTYTTPLAANATSYKWQLPPGAVVTSARSDTNTISFNAPSSTWCGDITVQPKNSCGVGTSSSLAVCIANASTGTVSSPLCGGAVISVPVSAPLGFFFSSNIFTAQLSDSAGSFANPVTIGSQASSSSTFINSTIPLNTISGTRYRIRVVSSSPATIGTDNGSDIVINAALTPRVSISANQTNICAGTTITFIATATSTGSTVTYQWRKNGTNVGTNTGSFSDNTLVDGDQVSCIINTSGLCLTKTTDTSNVIVLTTALGVPSVSITQDKSTVCAGSVVTFTATNVNGGITPVYQWKKNGNNVGTNSNIYTDNTLASSDIITCVLTSNATCLSTTTATSNSLSVTVNANLVPSVSIAASRTSVCEATTTSITFTATPVNGGTAPFYQWKKNGVNVGDNSNTFTSNTLGGGDVITCVLTSNAGCLTLPTVTSNSISITITPSVTPTVTVTASQTAICNGGAPTITFTAAQTNGGSAPIYKWMKNGVSVGTNSPTYSDNSFINGTTISCVMKSNSTAICLTVDSAISNIVVITVSSLVTPFILISSSTMPVCSGTSVTFNASTVFNGGTAPTYQWRKNGVNVGTSLATYTDNTLITGDIVSCILTSNAPCATTATVTSNTITASITNAVAPTVVIAASQNVICTGTTPTVNFTAIATNQGGAANYQWKKNGITVQNGFSTTYSTSVLASGDVISCTLTSSATCVTTSTVNSNNITISVAASATPSVTIAASQTVICGFGGGIITFTAIPVNGGTSPIYQWKRNGVVIGSFSTINLSSAGFTNGDIINCTITSNLSCVTTATAISNDITMTVSPVITPSVSIVASQTNICTGITVIFTATPTNGGTTPVYQWQKNGLNVGTNSPTYTDNTLTASTFINCILTSNLSSPCLSTVTAVSNTIVMSAAALVSPFVNISASISPVCGGSPVTFTATPTNGGSAPTYQWKKNSINVGTGNTYTDNTLNNGDVISCTLTSNASCLSTTTASSNYFVSVTTPVTPSVVLSATQSTICIGTTPTITFTATATNGGAPTYQWKRNGVIILTTSTNVISTNGFLSGDVISCTMISSITCVTATTANSNSITLTTAAAATPSVSINASQTTLCGSGFVFVNFTAIPTNGGSFPSYSWFQNGSFVGSGSAISLSSFTNNDVISCTMTSNLSCVTTTNASGSVTMTVTPLIKPLVNIVASQNNICAGTNVVFTATAVDGGASPSYQWKKNGVNVGTNAATYSDNTLTSGTQIWCVLTTSITSPCLSTTTATSNTITMSAAATVTPSVSINTPTTSICSGTDVVFTATPTNGGTAPVYQWKKNGINTGTNSNTYTDNALANNDVITCVLTSNASCISTPTATSGSIFMFVTPSVTASVSISSTQSVICTGTTPTITFTALPVNGGFPTYQWRKNGTIVATTSSSTYNVFGLISGDVITCTMNSTATCVTNPSVLSNSIVITSAASAIPAVSIAASTSSICAGSSVTFTATPTNGGSSPIYQWKKNGISVSVGSANTYTTSNLSNGDVISCVLTSTLICATGTATSNNIIITLTTPSIPSVTITSSADTVCTGTSVIFTATAINAGTAPSYQWYRNGAFFTSGTSTITVGSIANGNLFTCLVTVGGGTGCYSSTTASSNSLPIKVNGSTIPIINTIAGDGSTTHSGDGGAAPLAGLLPDRINLDASGNVYFVDFLNNRIKKIDAITGKIFTIAGTGTANSNGDGGLATNANLNGPSGVAVDISGNIYIVEQTGNRIRKIAAGTGIISTVIGNGTSSSTGDGGLAINATISNPYTVAIDNSGNVLFTESNTLVRKITTSTGIVARVAGNGSQPYSGDGVSPITTGMNPANIAIDKFNNIYIADYQNSRIRKITAVTGLISTIAGNGIATSLGDGGLATSGSVNAPIALCVDTAANVYVAELNGYRIRKISASTNIISTVAGNGFSGYNDGVVATTGSLRPAGVAVDIAGNIYIADNGNARIRKVSLSSTGAADVPTISSTASTTCGGAPVTLSIVSGNLNSATAWQWYTGSCGGTVVGTGTSINVTPTVTTTYYVRGIGGCVTGSCGSIVIAVGNKPVANFTVNNSSQCFTGNSFDFTNTSTVFGGTLTGFAWDYGNGVTATSVSPTYSYPTAGNFNVRLIVTSNSGCKDTLIKPVAVSDLFVPSVSISTPSTTVISGSSVTFTATPTNGGTAPFYQWKKNGVNVGTNSNTYITNTLINGDEITCTMTSSLTCVTVPTASSNALVMIVGSPVPVVLQYFTGNTNGNKNNLQWQVVSEINTSHYIIERSTNGAEFMEIGSVKANGNTTVPYAYTDSKLSSNLNYYRLKMMDNDGKFMYSNVVVLKNEQIVYDLHWYPNPVKNLMHLDIKSGINESIHLQITDMAGKLIKKQTVTLFVGNNSLHISTDHIAQGEYLLVISGMNKSVHKFIKE